jgi:3-deoxy-D-manno-octulosonic acid kinase
MTQIDSGNRPDEAGMLSAERIERIGASVILYDGSLINHMREAWFDPATWSGAPAAPGYSGGRGTTLFITCEGQSWVLRHYHRGGSVARVASDVFAWLGRDRTRSFAEWRLLARIREAGLPSPRPVAARYVRRGLLYRADLITVRIPGVIPLSTRLARAPLTDAAWRRVGECIGRFHEARVCHADLTAHNLQINGEDEIFLLDFDRGRIMPGPGPWRDRNLERLHRSLTKISGNDVIRFGEPEWHALMEGYRIGRS